MPSWHSRWSMAVEAGLTAVASEKGTQIAFISQTVQLPPSHDLHPVLLSPRWETWSLIVRTGSASATFPILIAARSSTAAALSFSTSVCQPCASQRTFTGLARYYQESSGSEGHRAPGRTTCIYSCHLGGNIGHMSPAATLLQAASALEGSRVF